MLLCLGAILISSFEYISNRESYYNSYYDISNDAFTIKKIEDLLSDYSHKDMIMNELKTRQDTIESLSMAMINIMNQKKYTALLSIALWGLAFIMFCSIYVRSRQYTN